MTRTMRYAGQGFLIGAVALIPILFGWFRDSDPRPLSDVWFLPLGAALTGAVLGALWPNGESRKKRRRAWLVAGLVAAPTLALAVGAPATSGTDLLVNLGIAAVVAILAGWAYSAGDEAARRNFPVPLWMEPPWESIRAALPAGFEAPSEPVNVLLDLELDEAGVVTRATAASPPTGSRTVLVTMDRSGRRVVEPKLEPGSDALAAAVAAGFIGLRFQFENPEDRGDWGRFRMGVGVRPEDLRPAQT